MGMQNCCNKIRTKIRIFQKFLGLFFFVYTTVFGQQKDNPVTIELSASTFTTERPYTISVIIRNSETRPIISFPDIQGLTKRGTATSITTNELNGEQVISQVVTQTYMATQPGVYRVQPFSIVVNGVTATSEGAVLLVRPSGTAPFGGTATTASLKIPTESGAAFLALRSQKASVYVGEGFAMRLSLFVADTYPFELRFDGVDAQLQNVLKQLRPTNAWEENAGIRELKGQPTVINNRKFTEYVISQGVFFPFSGGTIQIPSVKLTLTRVRQGAENQTAKPSAPEITEPIDFRANPITILVKPLPPHPLQGQVAVGTYRLSEHIDRTTVAIGKSTRYSMRIEGEGNLASLQSPLWTKTSDEQENIPVTPATEAGLEALPAGNSEQIDRTGEQIIGSRTFSYFLVPHRAGTFPLTEIFGLIYFDPQTARYDTLLPQISLRATETGPSGTLITSMSNTAGSSATDPIYAGIDQMDSTDQPLNLTVLTRAVANVLLVLMILGMIFVFFRK